MPNTYANGAIQRDLPPFPSWDELVDATSKDAALARASLYRLARSRQTPASSREIADDLPEIAGLGQTAARVGRVVRRYPSFCETQASEFMAWQVGESSQHSL
jgi:hypothetical protein